MDELKPCPFCGKKDTLELTSCVELEECANFESCDVDPFVCVVCSSNKGGCGATGGYSDSEQGAFEKWNRRPAPENKPLTLEQLTLDQLRQMDGEPVYIVVDGRPDLNAWHMVRRTDVGIIAIGAAAQTIYNYDGKLNFEGGTYYDIEHGNLYGKTWLAYARKPEKEEDHG